MKVFKEADILAIKDLVLSGMFKIRYDFIDNKMYVYVPKSQVLTAEVKKHLKSFSSVYTILEYDDDKVYSERVVHNTKFVINENTRSVVYHSWKDMDYKEKLLWIQQHPNLNSKNVSKYVLSYVQHKAIEIPTVYKVEVKIEKKPSVDTNTNVEVVVNV